MNERLQASAGLNIEENVYYQDLVLKTVDLGEAADAKRLKQYEITGVNGEIDRRTPLRHLKRKGNKIEVALCVTMYNEEIKELQDTMFGILKAVGELCANKISTDQIVVFLIVDGIEKIGADFLRQGEKIGFYKRRFLVEKGYLEESFDKVQNTVKYKPVPLKENILHTFQTRIKNFGFDEKRQNLLNFHLKIVHPINFFFGIKHLNKGKLDSHLFFFRGFCGYFKPKYAVLVDIGTEPLSNSISSLYDYMERNPDVGGCCGEIEVDVKNFSPFNISNLLVAAQYVEYKISHFLDKAFESVFGFVAVLPGAFCAFRYTNIEGSPLDKYFEGLDKENPGYNCFKANMYLAEDRIMCLEILIKRRQKAILRYVPGVKAKTDPPKDINVFIRQRRRWINGSNFASIYCLANFRKISQSAHTTFRKFFIILLYTYYFVNSILTFALVGSFYVTFAILVRNLYETPQNADDIFGTSSLLQNAYLLMLFLTLILSVCKDVDCSLLEYKVMIMLFGMFMTFSLYMSIKYFIIDGYTNFIQLVLVAGIVSSYAIPFLLNLCSITEPLAFVFGVGAYLFLTPMYVNIFVIYAFCNVHDVSWGNRASDGVSKKEKEFKAYRTNILIVWLLFNVGLAYFISYFNTSNQQSFILYFAMYIGIVLYIKIIGAILHKFYVVINKYCCSRRKRVFNMSALMPNKPEFHQGMPKSDIDLYM